MSAKRILLLAATATLAVSYLVLGTRPRMPEVVRDVPDTLIHAGAYALLSESAIVTAAAFAVPAPAAVGAVFAVAHGGLLEVLQMYAPPRTAEWRDLRSDAMGTAGAVVLWLLWRRRA